MKLLVWFSIGFAAAAWVCSWAIGLAWTIFLMILTAAGIGAAFYFRKKLSLLSLAAVILIGFLTGLVWSGLFQLFYLNTAVKMDGQTVTTTVEAADYSEQTQYGSAVDGRVLLDGKSYRVRVYLKGEQALAPGDRVTASFQFRVTTSGGEDAATYHQGNGIYLIAYQRGDTEIIFAETVPLRYYPITLREGITDILETCFPADTLAFAKALLLGDCDDISYDVDTDFKLSGIRHIIAVSGMHVSILYGFLSILTAKRRFLTALLGLPVLVVFAAVAGFTPSVVRACIMVALMMLATAFNREYDPQTSLAFSVVVMLLVNPLVITSVGFLLSVASVLGIYLFQKPVYGALMGVLGNAKGIWGKLAHGFSTSVAVTVGATILTTPLSAIYFGTVSLVSVVTNLLTLWVVSFLFYGIIGLCILFLIWQSGAVFLGSLLAWPIRYVLAVADIMAGLPMAAVYTRSPYIVIWLVFVYLLLTVFALSPEKKPWKLGCGAVTGLCIALLLSWAEPLMDECRVTVLDVGQGQSILLQSQGRTFLVDCGGDRDDETADLVAETLLSQGVNRLDGIILTHTDRDHCGGLEGLLSRVETDGLLVPAGSDPETLPAAEEITYVSQDLVYAWGNAALTVLAPDSFGNSNENSLCILFRTENCDILITGDRDTAGELRLLRHVDLPELELLIVGHHGSKYSTCETLLAVTTPETAIISVGEDNPYGHPTQEVLDRLEKYGCEVLRTDQNGTVIFRR